MKDDKIAVMAGTTEGRRLADFLEEKKVRAWILVATQYGEKVLPDYTYCKVHTGRFDAGQLKAFFAANKISCVYDATHPYAREVTANCVSACGELGIRYERILREDVRAEDYMQPHCFVRFESIEEAAAFLKEREGSVLVTTGSKETEAFRAIPDFERRVILRILPDERIKCALEQKGFLKEHIVMGQGPFSKEENLQLIRRFQVDFLLTKESGRTGGFVEKLEAAAEEGVFVLLIKRPKEKGIFLEEVMAGIGHDVE